MESAVRRDYLVTRERLEGLERTEALLWYALERIHDGAGPYEALRGVWEAVLDARSDVFASYLRCLVVPGAVGYAPGEEE